MKKSTIVATKTASKKTATKKSATKKGTTVTNNYTKVCDNIYRVSSTGNYRARLMKDGVKYSKNFRLLREAKAWVNSL